MSGFSRSGARQTGGPSRSAHLQVERHQAGLGAWEQESAREVERLIPVKLHRSTRYLLPA